MDHKMFETLTGTKIEAATFEALSKLGETIIRRRHESAKEFGDIGDKQMAVHGLAMDPKLRASILLAYECGQQDMMTIIFMVMQEMGFGIVQTSKETP